MDLSNEKMLGPGGAGEHRVSNDPPDSGKAVANANANATIGPMASDLDCRLEDGVSGAEGGREGGKEGGKGGRKGGKGSKGSKGGKGGKGEVSGAEGGGEDGGKGGGKGGKGRKGKGCNGGKRGKGGVPWSQEEREVLWEGFVRSGGVRGKGYMGKVKGFWDGERTRGRKIGDRGEPSLISQLGTIEYGGGLTLMVRERIGERVRQMEEYLEEYFGVDSPDEEDVYGDFRGFADSEEDGFGEAEQGRDEDVDFAIEVDQGGAGGIREDGGQVEARVDMVWEKGQAVREVSEVEKGVLRRMREVLASEKTEDLPNLKAQDRRKVMAEVKMVDGLLKNLVTDGMEATGVNRLLYVGAFVVAERLDLLGKGKKKKEKGKPWWQRRLERSIGDWRKDLGRVEEIRNGTEVGRKVRDRLERRYGMVDRGALAVSTFLKNKIRAASTKIKWFVGKCVQRRQNNLFKNNQKQLYKELSGDSNPDNDAPNATESRDLWSGLWSVDKPHNRDAVWMGHVDRELAGVEQQEEVTVQLDDVKAGIRRMANWKAPGPDGIRGFWFKKFLSLHEPITTSLQQCMATGVIPAWMVKGRTVLIQKDPAEGTVASNYRPIACLPLMWKLLTGIFADKIYDHLQGNNLLPDEQKGCRRRSRGTKDQLLIDKAVLREAKLKKRNLSMGWIDYRKAYDLVPHSWILEMMGKVKVAENVQGLLRRSMGDWKTSLTSNGVVLGEVDIKRGIFQGDSLSPLLFIIIMIPLSIIIRREKMGYAFGDDGHLIDHLLFMDDLKLYGKSADELEKLVGVVEHFTKDIGMEFGIKKCAVVSIVGGMKVDWDGIVLPNGEVMKEVGLNGYRYLGVLEGAGIMQKEMKVKVREEYLRRVKLVARSRLYAGNLMKGVNAWAVSVVRYSAGVLNWTAKELRAMDVRTRKLLTMFGAFHKRSSVDRLYMKRKDGGRGLISVRECVRAEEAALREYVVASEEWMLKVVAGTMEKKGKPSAAEYRERVERERKERLAQKKLHGKFLKDVKGVAGGRSWQWLEAGYLAKSTEAYVMAAQEQVLQTRLLRATVMKEDVDPLCRMCGKAAESVGHLASGCSVLAGREYRRRHDRMGLRVYWELCRANGIKCARNWYEEVPDEVRVKEGGTVEIWWDRGVQTTKALDHNRPDVVVVDRALKRWTLVDFAVPWDRNVATKETEKLTKYAALAVDIRKLHGVSTQVIPIVVGSLGIVTAKLPQYLKTLGIPDVLGGLQTSAIIGTTIILRKVLSL